MRSQQQRTFDGPELALEPKLPIELRACQCFIGAFQLRRRQQDAERDGEVVTTALLRQICRRKIDRDPAGGKFEVGVLQRRSHAVFAFPHRRGGQPDDGKSGQALA